MQDPSTQRPLTGARIRMWAIAGLVALAVLATMAMMARGSASTERANAPSPVNRSLADDGGDVRSLPGFGTGSSERDADGEGLGLDPRGGASEEEALSWEQQLEGAESQIPTAGLDPLGDQQVPSLEGDAYEIEIPDAWLAEAAPAPGMTAYRSDDGPDPLHFSLTLLGPGAGDELPEFVEFSSAVLAHKVTLGEATPVEVGDHPAVRMTMTIPDHPRPGVMWGIDTGDQLYMIVADLPADPATRAERMEEAEDVVQSFAVPEA